MITPLGPRGEKGVSKPMATPSLQPLELLVELNKKEGKKVRYSEERSEITQK